MVQVDLYLVRALCVMPYIALSLSEYILNKKHRTLHKLVINTPLG